MGRTSTAYHDPATLLPLRTVAPGMAEVEYGFDIKDRITAVHRPDAGYIHFAYDHNGNMTLLTNADNIEHGFSYSAVGKSIF